MATGFAYVPSTYEGLTVVAASAVKAEVIELAATCCGVLFESPRAYIAHLEGHRWAEARHDPEFFADDPFARDACA